MAELDWLQRIDRFLGGIKWDELERLEKEDPAAHAEQMETLEEMVRQAEANPLNVFKPHVKQLPFLLSRDPVKAFMGGNRSGKTTAGVVDDLIQALDEAVLPAALRRFKRWEPPFKCRVLVPDYKRTLAAVIDAMQEWVPKDQLTGGSWDKAYDKKRDVVLFRNGSKFEFMTHQQDLSQFGGVKLHRVHYDEEPPEDLRKECKIRLADFGGDEVFTMTPLNGMTYTYDQVYERRGEPGFCVVEVDMDDNPHLTEEGKRQALDGLSEEELEARKRGRFVHFGGMVLSGFDPDKHLWPPLDDDGNVPDIDPAHLKGQQIVVGIDPGIVRAGIVWCAYDKDDRLLVFDELYPQNLDVPTVCELIKDKNRLWGVEPDYVIDPSGRNRTMTGTVADEFQAHGIYAAPGLNGRRAGILQMRRRLASDPPALLVSRECTSLLWEIKRWRVDEDEDTDKPKSDETGDTFRTAGPDHLCDSLRYVCQLRWFGPDDDKPRRRPSFTPDFEGPYRPGSPQPESGPMGVLA